MKKCHCLKVLMVAVALTIFGCAGPKAKPQRVLWPVPPETPRLEWIAAFDSIADFPKTEFQKTMSKISGESAPAAFVGPIAAASDGKGRIFVSDIYAGNVVVVDFVQQKLYPLVKEPVFGRPIGMAVDSQGQIYVADGSKRHVAVVSPGGKVLRIIGSPDYLENPAFLAINEKLGRLYVSDGKGHKVVVFDLEGEHLFSFGHLGNDPGAFHSPQGIAFSSDGRLFVADLFNARIQSFDADGNYLSQFGERGDRLWQFETPKGLAIDSEDHIYIVDQRKKVVLVYDTEGGRLMTIGAGVPAGHRFGFISPVGIQIDQNDRIVIGDMMSKQLLVWQYLSEGYLRENPIEPAGK